MKYYKILNEKENHHGLQYHTGLNEDILPWNPNADCKPGGIYFASEDILSFLLFGPWIREITIPDGVEVTQSPGRPTKYKAHKVILGERRRIDVNIIKELIDEGADPDSCDALRWASGYGHIEIVKLLLDCGCNPKNPDALYWASKNGHIEIVKLLLDHKCSPKNPDALRWASAKGHIEIVKLLEEYKAKKRVTP